MAFLLGRCVHLAGSSRGEFLIALMSQCAVLGDVAHRSAMLETRSQSLSAGKVRICFDISLLVRPKYWVGLYRELIGKLWPWNIILHYIQFDLHCTVRVGTNQQ